MPRTPSDRRTPHSSFRAVNRKAADRATATAGNRVIRQIAIVVVVLFVGAAWAARAMEERLVLTPPATASTQPEGVQHVPYNAPDGQRLFAYAVEPADSTVRPAGVIVVYHGHDESARSWIPWARDVAARTGWLVFIAEFRGYGGLFGVPGFSTMSVDAQVAYNTAAARYGITPDSVVIYGRGFGAGVALEVASDRRVHAVVLEAPMETLRSLESRVLSPPAAWVVPIVSRNTFKPRDVARAVISPIWVAVGGRDRLVPESAARSVFDAARIPGEFLVVASAAHNDIPEQGGDDYWTWLERALGVAR